MLRLNQKRVLEEISKNPVLKKAFRFYLDYNVSYDNPYHNVNHTLAMMDLMLKMNDETPIDDLDTLLIAAIFHDMNHSGGLITDDKNVQNAINAYTMFTNTYGFYYEPVVARLILATKFPYGEEELTHNQRVIRECDNLVPFYDDFFTQVLMGLRSEMHTTDLIALCDGEMKFFDYSWSKLTLPFSRSIIEEYGDELKNYILNIKESLFSI